MDKTPNNTADKPLAKVTGIADRQTTIFELNFLRMALDLWATDFPDSSIQGVSKARALKSAGEITGRKYGPGEFAKARDDLNMKRQEILQTPPVRR